jgi:hypothetical protein
MFNSSVLDVAVGVALVFLLVSTVCSAAREGVEAYLKTRASHLEYAIRELLNDRGGVGLAKAFFEHPMISGLYQGDYEPRVRNKTAPEKDRPRWWHSGGTLPSYIPAKSFSMALIDLVARGPSTNTETSAADLTKLTFDSLRQSVRTLNNPKVERALLTALDTAHDDVDLARKNLEAWYDGAMDRVSGWYKRSTQTVILLIAIVVVVGLNVNVITIADHLYRDQSLRDAVVGSAAGIPKDLSYADASSKFEAMRLPVGWGDGWGAPRTRGERVELENARRLKDHEKKLEASRASAGNPPTPPTLLALDKLPVDLWHDLFGPIVGLLITTVAAMLGAPFWFDVLNKIMVIRATVKPHEKSREEGSEDRQSESVRVVTLEQLRPAASPNPGSGAVLPQPAPANDVGG